MKPSVLVSSILFAVTCWVLLPTLVCEPLFACVEVLSTVSNSLLAPVEDAVYDTFSSLFSAFPSLGYALKFLACISFLIVIRGCIPRYRYDFLTKLGWVKFLAFVLSLFLFALVFTLMW